VSILGSASRIGTEREQRHGVRGAAQSVGRRPKREGNGMVYNCRSKMHVYLSLPFILFGVLKVMCFKSIVSTIDCHKGFCLFRNMC
jgi:hypothetical protein